MKAIVVDDQPEARAFVRTALEKARAEIVEYESGEALLAGPIPRADVVILDLDLGPGRIDGIETLRRLRDFGCRAPAVFLSGRGSVARAVEAMRLGAADFIEKTPVALPTLSCRVEGAVARARNERDAAAYRREAGARSRLVGGSPALDRVRAEIERFAAFPRPVLVVGERGTGKEIVARALHEASPRRGGVFVVVNCAALPEGVASSELFGHERGAFTGAVGRRIGRFEEADGGTLFLDEVGKMPPDLQRMLVRVIEYPAFRRVGGEKEIEVDVRIVAATNVPLEGREGFLPDLLDRLRYAEIRLPPLRERPEEIPLLARHFLEELRLEAPSLRAARFSPEAIAALESCSWPGNVRELKAVVECAAFASVGDEIEVADLPLGAPHEALRAPAPPSLSGEVEAYEREKIEAAVRSARTIKEAAERLGVSYDAMRRLVRKHGIRTRR